MVICSLMLLWLSVEYSVSQKKPVKFSGIFLTKQLGIFCPNFTSLLYVPIYVDYKLLFKYLQLGEVISASGGHWWLCCSNGTDKKMYEGRSKSFATRL